MRNSKLRAIFGVGRKWIFTLALFLLVFAAASVVKIHAGTSDSGQGWLWGGGAEPDGAAPYDGTNTNVGWISVNNTNPEITPQGTTSYGVNFPSGNGPVTGYAWSENIGWISFNAADTVNCPQNPCGAVRVVGNNIKGWARIMSISQAGANAGGWQGWISLSGGQYGVKINQDNTLTGFGWSDELGWIDFSRARVAEVCSLRFVPTPPDRKLINENSSDAAVLKEVGSSCNCGSVSLASSNPAVANATTPSPVDFSSPTTESKNIAIQIGSVVASANYDNIITATSPNCGNASLSLAVQNVLDCHISCPDSVEVTPGEAAENIEISSSGTECGGLSVSGCGGTQGNITIGGPTGGKCTASAASAATFKESTTATVSTNVGSCSTKVFVKRLGWTETNP